MGHCSKISLSMSGKLRKHGSERGQGNRCMGETLWRRRETRRKMEKTNLILQHLKEPVYSTSSKVSAKIHGTQAVPWILLQVSIRAVRGAV